MSQDKGVRFAFEEIDMTCILRVCFPQFFLEYESAECNSYAYGLYSVCPQGTFRSVERTSDADGMNVVKSNPILVLQRSYTSTISFRAISRLARR